MPLLRPFYRPNLWLALWVALIALVIAGSLLPADELPKPAFVGIDKLEHFLGYAVLSGYAVMLFERARAHAVAAVAMLLLGIAIEFAQGAITQSRRADAIDVLANTLGVLVGWALRFMRVRHLLQRIDAVSSKQGGRSRY